MSLHIVIDGYNLIRQSRRFSKLEQLTLQAGREGLLAALAAYKKLKPHKLTVVFDGTGAETGLRRREKYKGIDVLFSNAGESADSVIKQMAAREGERLLVVSSDLEITVFADSRGSATISAVEFEERLEMAQSTASTVGVDQESSGWRPSTKKRGPARRLPKKQRRTSLKKAKL